MFQYISCYSLSRSLINFSTASLVSIHLMLLFIFLLPLEDLIPESFQYISCYSLSHCKSIIDNFLPAFQYISCYSLSTVSVVSILTLAVSIHLMLLFIYVRILDEEMKRLMFQYISCYSLSKSGTSSGFRIQSFNTSHVTLYPSFYRLFFF